MRGIAALEVCMGHLRRMIFVTYPGSQKNAFTSAFYFVTGFSHQSVVIFFVLSGFLISRNIQSAWLNKKWSVKNYSVDRLTRLWVVVIPGLIITLLIDHLGLKLFPASSIYTNSIRYLGGVDPAKYLHAAEFFGNIFFLQTILVHTFGSNVPLWSLSNEFWYYVLFPLVYFAYQSRVIWRKIILLLMAIGVVFFIGRNISIYFTIWLVGFVVVLCRKHLPTPPARSNRIFTGLATIIFLGVLVMIRVNLIGERFHDFVLGVVTGVLMYGLLGARDLSGKVKTVSVFFSKISFSLYVIHFPIACFLTAWIIREPVIMNGRYFLFYVVAFLCILLSTVLFWYLFESRYTALRTFFKGKLSVIRVKENKEI